jgi:hypothetical protein
MLLLNATGWSEPAFSYVRSESKEKPIRWHQTHWGLRLSDPGPSAGFTLEELERESRAAFDSWLSSCTQLKVDVRTGLSDMGRVARDGESVVVTRSKKWCPDGANHQSQCYDSRLQANTTVRFEPDGASAERTISEADVELNAVDYRWHVGLEDRRGEGLVNLRSILAHEFGHLFGLAHDCGIGEGFVGVDGNRQRLRPCEATRHENTLMYAGPGELGRPLVFEPTSEERQALCQLYPRESAGACSVSGGQSRHATLLVALVVVLIGIRRVSG